MEGVFPQTIHEMEIDCKTVKNREEMTLAGFYWRKYG
jgi:hypothetical protein